MYCASTLIRGRMVNIYNAIILSDIIRKGCNANNPKAKQGLTQPFVPSCIKLCIKLRRISTQLVEMGVMRLSMQEEINRTRNSAWFKDLSTMSGCAEVEKDADKSNTGAA